MSHSLRRTSSGARRTSASSRYPPTHAQDVIDKLVRGGVRAILNYAPIALQVPPEVEVRQVDPVLQLQSMTYHLRRRFAD